MEFDHIAGNAYYQRTFSDTVDWSGYQSIELDIWSDQIVDIALVLGTGPDWTWNMTYAKPVTINGDSI